MALVDAGPGTWKAAKDKAFRGLEPGLGPNHAGLCEKAGVPNENTGKVGVFCWDYTNGDLYITTDGAGTWVKCNA